MGEVEMRNFGSIEEFEIKCKFYSQWRGFEPHISPLPVPLLWSPILQYNRLMANREKSNNFVH